MSLAVEAPAARHRAEDVEEQTVDVEKDDGAERGRTTLEPRTVKKIAAHAVAEVPGVGDGAKVDAAIDRESATLTVSLEVRYPESVARTTEAARAHLMARTAALTGLTVPKVDIVVTALRSEETGKRRVQ
ncbi:Asp23/Gls24 family envelope stress response protein [Amycolatopsis minnesotensis]|uniref:Asp23/Gls24 family envelope stress response protein n=1 Tax=Amycolatopsis minnesotensis TaxID=337894 RepID=A0ABN2S3T5_9PSEU